MRTCIVQSTYWERYHHYKYRKNTSRRNSDVKTFTAEAKDCEQCKCLQNETLLKKQNCSSTSMASVVAFPLSTPCIALVLSQYTGTVHQLCFCQNAISNASVINCLQLIGRHTLKTSNHLSKNMVTFQKLLNEMKII